MFIAITSIKIKKLITTITIEREIFNLINNPLMLIYILEANKNKVS